MGTMIGSGNDVVSFLKMQHQQIKEMFEDVISARGEEREKKFYALRRLLAVHETAEEEIVHPVAKRALPDGEAVVEARLREENEAKRALADLENADVDSAEFIKKLSALRTSVIAHAEAEEREELRHIGNQLDAGKLDRMRKAVELAEAVAPTRPHPGVESAAANLLAGPFAAMVDRARDALSGKA
jgi:hypothetical protein